MSLPSTQRPPSQLCSSCQNIHFTALLPTARLDVPEDTLGSNRGKWKSGGYLRHPSGRLEPKSTIWQDNERWDLGLLSDVISRVDNCPLCWLIVRTLQKHEGTDYLRTEIDGYPLSCRAYQEKIGDMHEEVGVCQFQMAGAKWRVSRLRFACFSKAGARYRGFAAPYAAQIGPPFQTISKAEKTASYMGRHRPVRCDITLVKSWIGRCLGGHAQCSKSARGLVRGPVRLIDMEENCLKTFEDVNNLDLQYMTLSYVWGGCKKDFVLTIENLFHYHEPNSLGHLPKIITDAMCFVHMLGQRFLWVDALCIIQNDLVDYAVQIPAMKAIYGGSLLTIIAAFGDDADAGLPGINTDRLNPMIVDVGQFTVIESTTPLDPFCGSPVIKTTWNTRAWTFQEYLLSPCSIIFLEGQAYWSCRIAEWFEEMDFEGLNFRFVWGNNNINGRTELTVKNYGNLIEQYTKRKLTYDEDIYDAFSGILEAIPNEFFWGIPYSMFGEYLCWTEQSPGEKREDDGPLQRRYLKDAPSWSWVAWKGAISMTFGGVRAESFLSCFRYMNNTLVQMSTPGLTSFRIESFDTDEVLNDEVVWSGPHEYGCTMEDIPMNVSLTENYVVFWARVVKLQAKEACEHDCFKSRNLEDEPNDRLFRYYALIGRHVEGELHILELSWESGIARRERLHLWYTWPASKAERKLVILG